MTMGRLKYIDLVGPLHRAAQIFERTVGKVPPDLADWEDFLKEEGDTIPFSLHVDPLLGEWGAERVIGVLEALCQEGFEIALRWGGWFFDPHPEEEELLRWAEGKGIPVVGLPDGGQG